ncbi:MAG: SDR family oxidoreductase [Xanthomonadales bacterium]|nr:SDR family oxidoreductase [Xanthomonadales bacterium]
MDNRPTALVTGASAGIGAAFARDLAARGYDLVLTARRVERLETLAAELVERHGTRCTVLPADLEQPEAPALLAAELERRGVAVEMLVNNAGYGVPGYLLDADWPTHARFLRIMVGAPVELAWLLLPGMLARGRGHVVNVASVAGLIPGSAGHTLYAAAKAFLIRFSQSLALEYRGRGVHTSAVCPGFTWSEFHDVNGSRPIMDRLPSWMWLQADRVAREGIDAVLRGKVVQISGLQYKAIHLMTKLLPERLLLRMTARRSAQFRVQGR